MRGSVILSPKKNVARVLVFFLFNCFLKNVDSCVCNIIFHVGAVCVVSVVWNGISNEITSCTFF